MQCVCVYIPAHLHVRDMYEPDCRINLCEESLGSIGAVISASLCGLDRSRQDRGKRAAMQGRPKEGSFSRRGKNGVIVASGIHPVRRCSSTVRETVGELVLLLSIACTATVLFTFLIKQISRGENELAGRTFSDKPEKHAEAVPPSPLQSLNFFLRKSALSYVLSSLISSRINTMLLNTETGHHRRLSRESLYYVGSPRYLCRGL